MTVFRRRISDRRARGERGAILVESALILPIFLLLVFGVIEFSISFWSTAMIEDAARRGGRVASQVGRTESYENQIAEAVIDDVRKLPGTATPLFLAIFKANENGYPGNPDNLEWVSGFEQCSAVNTCMLMAWNAAEKDFALVDDGVPFLGIEESYWAHTDHQFCPYSDEGIDRIGVAVGMYYKPLLAMYDSFLRRDDENYIVRSSVLSFEPGPTSACGGI